MRLGLQRDKQGAFAGSRGEHGRERRVGVCGGGRRGCGRRADLDQVRVFKRSRTRGQVAQQRIGDGGAEGHIALLAALAADAQHLRSSVDGVEIEPAQLGVADAAAVEQLQNQRIALGPRGGGLRGGEVHRLDEFFGGRHPGQTLGQARRVHQRCRVAFKNALTREPLAPGAHRGQRARNRRAAEAALVERVHVLADKRMGDRGGRRRLHDDGGKGGKTVQLAGVGAERVRGGAALMRQRREVAPDRLSPRGAQRDGLRLLLTGWTHQEAGSAAAAARRSRGWWARCTWRKRPMATWV